jgi:uncharacterized OB-fold protein
MSMTSHHDKTIKSLALFACIISACAIFLVNIAGAADKADEEVAVATVTFVDEDNGVILLSVDKTRKISDLKRGDEIEVVIEEETGGTQDQQPRKWRLMRHPYGGPSDK